LKPTGLVVVALFSLMLLASPVLAASSPNASGGAKNSQPLSLELEGLITNAGDQRYSLGGGQLLQGVIGGHPLPAEQVSLSMFALVHGLAVNGKGSLQIPNAPNGGNHGHGGLNLQFSITGAVPAAIFPGTPVSPSTFLSCDPTTQHCTSEIPLLFTGFVTVQSNGGTEPHALPIAVESPYWNPFGGPIIITSLDSATNPTIFLLISYSSATIGWSGVQLQGEMGGALGSESVTGSYNQVTFSQENLVAGTESDAGSIAFVGMSDPVLNSHGAFAGHTTFSSTGSVDCAPLFGLPEGTCYATGATSDGSFWMLGSHGVAITGSYHTIWSVPSLFTQTTVMGAVIQH
jgi:hypothetical protein